MVTATSDNTDVQAAERDLGKAKDALAAAEQRLAEWALVPDSPGAKRVRQDREDELAAAAGRAREAQDALEPLRAARQAATQRACAKRAQVLDNQRWDLARAERAVREARGRRWQYERNCAPSAAGRPAFRAGFQSLDAAIVAADKERDRAFRALYRRVEIRVPVRTSAMTMPVSNDGSWLKVGEIVDLPAKEAWYLCDAGYAAAVEEKAS